MGRSLGGLQSQAVRYGEVKILYFLGYEVRPFIRSDRSQLLDDYPTEAV
jgi:hypothetical protein